ncbi:MAG: spore germination protein [Bacilli bacterium]
MEQFNYNKVTNELNKKNLDYTQRTIPFSNGTVKLFYILQIIDRTTFTESVLKPLILYCSSKENMINASMTVNGIIFADDCRIETDASKIEDYILEGLIVILFSNDSEYVVVNLRNIEHRNVSPPEISYTVRGPKDCFTENMDVNLSLIRYRIKDKNIRIKKYEVGTRTKARVAVIYIEDIANNKVVTEITKKIEAVSVDGIGESGELQAFLLNNKMDLFPNMGLVERSDMACHSLLDGKVLVLVDGSDIALMAPKVFSEFFSSGDDRYDNKFFGVFARLLRYIAIIIAFTSTSLFVALTSFHTDVLPSNYAIMLAEMRINVPFSALVGTLILELIIELLREALIRVPKQIGSAVGIVASIVIGQAAISAGIFSPLLLIIVSVSFLASFAIPDYTLVNPFRILKLFLLLFTGALGFFGFTLFLTVVLIELVSYNSFGVPYLAPWAPFNSYDFVRTLINNITINPKRPKYLNTKDKTKQ